MKKYGLLLAVIALCGLVVSCGGITGKSDSKFALEAARKGLWKEALFRWKMAVEEEPNNAKLHNNLAIAYENEGEYDLALKEYRIALRLDPGNYHINNNYSSFLRFYQKLKPEEEGEEKETEKPPPVRRIQ
ncbi:MAG: tetratricopeptide repeat protein [Candidatus Aminicenantes bacterium]|nr:tetratricopeptide repeat protein [Candidatus Aminicenantes bacterium]MDH5715975.1 tetratricopeptide repeat protein [Candidatus Aminicenantes bacterium]